MHTHPKFFVLVAYNFENMPKTGFWNVANVSLKSPKNQTNGDKDLKYGLK